MSASSEFTLGWANGRSTGRSTGRFENLKIDRSIWKFKILKVDRSIWKFKCFKTIGRLPNQTADTIHKIIQFAEATKIHYNPFDK